jgi:hypothetical protein
MKKFIFIFFLAVSGQNLFCQNSFDKIVKSYYRVNPYDRKFSTALNNILSDTAFVKTGMEKRTDSGFFFLSGYYKRFNPFDFKTSRTELRLAETELLYGDSFTNDTIIIYQILGIAEKGEEGKEIVQKEFNRFHRRFSHDFWKSDYKEGKTAEGEITAGIYNYFFFGFQVPPLSIAWGKMPGEDNYTFTISLRIKVKENFASQPKSPDEQKNFPQTFRPEFQ